MWAASLTVLPQQNGAWPETRQAGQPSGWMPFMRATMATPKFNVHLSPNESSLLPAEAV